MGDEVEASAQRVRDHLQRPDHPDRQLTNAKVGSTVNQTAPIDGFVREGMSAMMNQMGPGMMGPR
jgi:hypothetical protein